MTRPTAALRRDVTQRAGDRCEYCRIHQEDTASRHQVDHIIAEKHGGMTALENLALSCLPCNRRKASDIAALDPKSGQLTALFNPRTQTWSEHFQFVDAKIIGLTAEGRTTVEFLQFNSPERTMEREELMQSGRLQSG